MMPGIYSVSVFPLSSLLGYQSNFDVVRLKCKICSLQPIWGVTQSFFIFIFGRPANPFIVTVAA
jgi:hypothetical protein